MALFLTACGGGGSSKTPPQPAEQTGSLYGQLQGTTATTVRPMAQIVEGPEFVATVNAQQQFSLALPPASVVEGKYNSDLIALSDVFTGCTLTPATDVKVMLLNSLQTNTNQELKAISYLNGAKTYTYWWFANKTATTTVNGSCLAGTFNNRSLSLVHGWNKITWTTNGQSVDLNAQAPTSDRQVWTPTSLEGQTVHADFDLPWRQLDKYKTR